MTLELNGLTKRYDDVTAVSDVSLDAGDDDFLVLVGPSGSGKTTTLRMIAGLETPSEGEIRIDGVDVTDRSPADRNIAMVFQNYALYPHLTVRKNMSLALEVAGIDDEAVQERVESAAEMLDIPELLDRKPGELSGGQQQRVALGRALVRDPAVFLMDEPLSNLDAKLRMEMRKEIELLHEEMGTTFVYVTHDQTEAMTMGTKIAVLDGGMLQQIGSPDDLYERPANEFVAEFIGSPSMNVFDATIDGTDPVELALGPFDYELPADLAERVHRSDADRLSLGFRPEHVELVADGPFSARVNVVEPVGAETIVYLESNGYEFTAQVAREENVEEREQIRFALDPERIHLFGDGTRLKAKTSTVVDQ